MSGGIAAWEGLVAEGAPEAGMAWFGPSSGPDELIALAWLLEEGSRKFYSRVSSASSDPGAGDLLAGLALAEEHHKATLADLYEQTTGGSPGFPHSVVGAGPGEDRMEGGMSVSGALRWAEGRGIGEVLELSMSLEANSLDLYIKMERAVEGEKSRGVFRTLAEEEKTHLEKLAGLLEDIKGRR
jgi:rubrerythrin